MTAGDPNGRHVSNLSGLWCAYSAKCQRSWCKHEECEQVLSQNGEKCPLKNSMFGILLVISAHRSFFTKIDVAWNKCELEVNANDYYFWRLRSLLWGSALRFICGNTHTQKDRFSAYFLSWYGLTPSQENSPWNIMYEIKQNSLYDLIHVFIFDTWIIACPS